MQRTPDSELYESPIACIPGTADHCVPFQWSAMAMPNGPPNARRPTAVQFVADTQATPFRKSPTGAVGDHVEPS